MTTNPSTPPVLLPATSAVQVHETSEFSASAKVFSQVELRAIQLALAEDPMAGEPINHMPGLFQLPFGGYHVIYSFSPDMTSIFFLLVSASPPIPPPSGGKGYSKARDAANTLAKGGLFALGKKSVDWLIEAVQEVLK
jgi:hypothetical protein